jgi:amidase
VERAPVNPVEYADCDAMELAARIAGGSISAAEAIEACWRVIDALDGPIHAFVSLEKDLTFAALRAARPGPLSGVPIAMKDCVGFVAGALRNFGSRLRPSIRADHDDEVVARFRAGGLIPLGTTNVPELSSSLTTESRLHGPCRNPWSLAHSCGGSSGGAAAAVAYGAVPIAYGNDSAGSIRVPAACCGVFGFRPSRGRVPLGPRDGEIWFGLLAHHVITRSVRDSALVLDLTEGTDAGAPYGAPAKVRPYLDECRLPPAPLRIAVSDGAAQGFALAPECTEALAATAENLRMSGHAVVAASPEYSGEEMIQALNLMLAVAVAEELPALARTAGREIGEETVECALRALLERGTRTSAVKLSAALAFRNTAGRALGRLLRAHDVLLTPALAMPPARLGWLDADSADTDGYLERMWRYSPFAPLANLCGVPSMSVPLARTAAGLPIGMMFTARYGEEGTLFRLAAELERSFPWRDVHPPHSAWAIMRPG